MAGSWEYDELRQVGIDFADPEEVAAYDKRQGVDPAAADELLDRLDTHAGETLVDLGAGTGLLSLRAAQRGLTVHVVDVSPAMLAHARARAERLGLTGVTFHHAGFLTYRHGSPGADHVVSAYALHHLPDFWKGIALLHVSQILHPGGQFLLRDVIFSFPLPDYARGVEAWTAAVAHDDGSGWTRADLETHIREENSTFGWVLEGLIERAGLQLLEARYEGGAYTEYLCRKP